MTYFIIIISTRTRKKVTRTPAEHLATSCQHDSEVCFLSSLSVY